MKTHLEMELFQMALNQPAEPGTTLTSFFMDLPESNARVHLCAFRDRKWKQLTAMLLPTEHELWNYFNPPQPRGELILPDYVVRRMRQTLRYFGIRHLIGVMPESKVPQGVLLTSMYPETPQSHMLH